MIEPGRHDSKVVAARISERLAAPGLGPKETEICRRWNAVTFPGVAERWAALASSVPQRAEPFLRRAICLAPDDFRMHFNLSNRLLSRGNLKRAAESLARVMLLSPSFPISYGKLLAISPDVRKRLRLQGSFWVSGGGVQAGILASERLIAGGHYVSADEILSRILAETPLQSDAWRHKAVAQHRRRALQGARRDHCRAIIANPAQNDSYLAAFGHFCECRSFEAAERMLGFAEKIVPNALANQINRGSLLDAMGRSGEALEHARRSLLREPGIADINYNIGTAFGSLGKVADALTFQERASIIDPNSLRFKSNFAIALLKAGRYRRGFEAYEYRWHAETLEQPSIRTLLPVPSFDLPLWAPGNAGASHILLWGEQGLGDEIWALGCLKLLAGRPERFAIETDPRLVPLAQKAFPHMDFLARDASKAFDCGKYDAQLPLLSLPHCLGRPDKPVEPGWARPGNARLAEIRSRLAGDRDVRLIGLAWRSIKPVSRWSFDLSLSRLNDLAGLTGTLFMPLQYGMSGQDWDAVTGMFGAGRVLRPDFDVWNDISALAEAVAAMDAVVTAATMLVPLSVATGTPAVAVLNEVQRDWRYAPGQAASPMLPGVVQLWPPGGDGKPAPGEELRAALERACRSRDG